MRISAMLEKYTARNCRCWFKIDADWLHNRDLVLQSFFPNDYWATLEGTMRVTYFRKRVAGPELAIEDTVAVKLRELFFSEDDVVWTAGSLWLGSTQPDLLAVGYLREVERLRRFPLKAAWFLAILQHYRSVTEELLRNKGLKQKEIRNTLDLCQEYGLVREASGSYQLEKFVDHLLPDVVAIEAKISDWKGARSQCYFTQLYAQRVVLAMPPGPARIASKDPKIQQWGMGVLAVTENGDIKVLRRPRRTKPRLWVRYFELAIATARLMHVPEVTPREAREILVGS